MIPKVIIIAGEKGVGKGTLATYLGKFIPNISQLGWSDPLKEEVCLMFGITREHLEANKETKFRRILQEIGKLHREYQGDNFFIDKLKDRIDGALKAGNVVVFTDTRFATEAGYGSQIGGIVIRASRTTGLPSDSDISETSITNIKADIEVDLDVGVESTDPNFDRLMTQKAQEVYDEIQAIFNNSVSERKNSSGDIQPSQGSSESGKLESSPVEKRTGSKNNKGRSSRQVSSGATDEASGRSEEVNPSN